MKKHISRSGGMKGRFAGLLQSVRHWWKSLYSDGVREKINNSKLSWEERLLLMGLIIVAGILLLGIKLYENNRSNQQAYAQLDESRAVLMATIQLRTEINEQLQGSQESPGLSRLNAQIATIRSIKKHSAVQENRLRTLQSMLLRWQASGNQTETDEKNLHNLLDGIMAEEQRNLEVRKADVELGNSIDQRLYVLLLVTLVILVLFAGYVLYKNQLATLQAKQQLENNKQILQSIIDNSSTMVYVKDMLGRFIFKNKNFEEVFGKSGEHLDESLDETVLETRTTTEIQENLLIDGTICHFYSIRFPLLNKHNQVYATAGILTDITEMIQKQEASKEKELLKNTLAVQESERMEIGMELHDNITQLLASAKLMLDTAIRQTTRKDEHLEKARDDVFTAIHETRKLSHSLVVPGLETESLTDAVMRLLERLKTDNRLMVQLKLVSRKKINSLEPGVRLALYRILQEQVNNIIKHADASSVLVELRYVSDSIQLIVEDDGVGFDPDQYRPGIGLSNINRRVRHLGGDCRVHSMPGEGCQLKILIPL